MKEVEEEKRRFERRRPRGMAVDNEAWKRPRAAEDVFVLLRSSEGWKSLLYPQTFILCLHSVVLHIESEFCLL